MAQNIIDNSILESSTNGNRNLSRKILNIVADYYPHQIQRINYAIENNERKELENACGQLASVLNDVGAISAAKTSQVVAATANLTESGNAEEIARRLELQITQSLELLDECCGC